MNIKNHKYQSLNPTEMSKINGGGFVTYKPIEGSLYYVNVLSPDNTVIKMSYWQEQRYTWWGLYGTSDKPEPCQSIDN